MLAATLVFAGAWAAQADTPPPLPEYHLTARPWHSDPIGADHHLARIESLARFLAGHQDERGAIIDPVLKREHQYATPYFAYGVGTLIEAGRARDLWAAGVAAMDHATASLAGGNDAIPDQHGEFFIAPLTEALERYRPAVDTNRMHRWRERMATPIDHIIESPSEKINNWRTYAMKGEWLRHKAGLVSRKAAVEFIEDAWNRRTQRERLSSDRWNLYQDWNGHPQSHAVEAVGRGNLLALVTHGYDGPAAMEIERAVRRGTAVSLLLQDPTGQCPPNGRTDNHVFNDVLYALSFTAMSRLADDKPLAGRYRRAATLSLRSIDRWMRDDGPWAGMYAITKNFFDPARRVGYQPASQVGNYTGAAIYHLAETYRATKQAMPHHPAPTEIGGYAFATDRRFGSAVANAGGMQVFANLLGDSVPKYGKYWTPLGIVRFSRTAWDSRLGPSDGARTAARGEAVTFGPTWRQGGRWVRLADMAEHYRGTLTVEVVHPLLVRCSFLYVPVTGVGGPSFRMRCTITPDGVLTELSSPNDVEFALTVPLLENDGRQLHLRRAEWGAGTAYSRVRADRDEQWFIGVDKDQTWRDAGDSVLSAYGWLKPLRVTGANKLIRVFVYPRSPGDPPAQVFRESFKLRDGGFESILGRVDGTMYRGRWSAGGLGSEADIDGDGAPDLRFNRPCGFVVQHNAGAVTALETDRDVTAVIGVKEVRLTAYSPWVRGDSTKVGAD